MYIHGGHNDQKTHNDIHKLDSTTMVWSLINTSSTPPPASSGHSATIIGTKMFVFGGFGRQENHNSITVFDTETNCWLNVPSSQPLPEPSRWHSAFAYNEELYIFGGCGNRNQCFNDLWKFSQKTLSWKKVEPRGKVPCEMCLMCCCMVGDCIIIHGGNTGNNLSPGDLFILDLNPSLKTLCKLAVTQHGLDQTGLTHDISWELAAMTGNSNRKN